MDEENQQNENKNPAFESLDYTYFQMEGRNFRRDYRRLEMDFQLQCRYKGAIAFYLILVFSAPPWDWSAVWRANT